MYIKILILIIVIETIYILWYRSTLIATKALNMLLATLDSFINIYGSSFIQTRVLFDMIANNQTLSQEEFDSLKKDYTLFIWSSLPRLLKRRLKRHVGLDETFLYILNKIDPIISGVYKVNADLTVREE